MPQSSKASRELDVELWVTAFQFVGLPAIVTAEVMVVRLPGNLVTRRFTRELYGNEPAFLDHGLQIAVYRPNAQVTNSVLRITEHFLRR